MYFCLDIAKTVSLVKRGYCWHGSQVSMANAKTVMVLCNILKLSKSQAHNNKKNPQNNQRGTAAVRQSYFKRFSYFPQLFLTKNNKTDTYRYMFWKLSIDYQVSPLGKLRNKRSVRLSRIWMRNFQDDTFYISVAITTMAIVLGIAYPFVVLYSNKSIVYTSIHFYKYDCASHKRMSNNTFPEEERTRQIIKCA